MKEGKPRSYRLTTNVSAQRLIYHKQCLDTNAEEVAPELYYSNFIFLFLLYFVKLEFN